MLDAELAELYRIENRAPIQAMKRNIERFPGDFMFQLNKDEWRDLRSQIVISRSTWGGRRYPPYAFTGARCRHAVDGPEEQACRSGQY